MDIEDMSIESIETFLKKKKEEEPARFKIGRNEYGRVSLINSEGECVAYFDDKTQIIRIFNDGDGHWENSEGTVLPVNYYYLKKGYKEE